MTTENFVIRKLADELQPPDSGRKSIVLADDADTKVIQLEFTVGDELAEHAVLPPTILRVFNGEASLMVDEETEVGKPGTLIRKAPGMPHRIKGLAACGDVADAVAVMSDDTRMTETEMSGKSTR